MDNKRPLVPSFLQKMDDWLLKNKPSAWSARTHLVLYFGLLFGVVLSLLCFVVFRDARENSMANIWSPFVGLISFIGFVFWLIFLLRFNVFKRFGNWQAWDGLKTFGLYFINIALMVFVVFIPYIVECINANHQYADEEVVKDINELNLTACRLEYNSLPLDFRVDTVELIKYVPEKKDPDSVVAREDYEEAPTVHRPDYIPVEIEEEFLDKIDNADSLKKISDSLYVLYKCPDYALVHSYSSNKYNRTKQLTSMDIYNEVLKNYKRPDKKELSKKMQLFRDKYATYTIDHEPRDNRVYDEIIKDKYHLYEINRSIDNIIQKKYWWQQDWQALLRVFFYPAFILTLLVFMFRHSTIKTFFLSLLASILLLIVTSLMIAMSNGSEFAVLSFILFYYILFSALSLSIKAASVRNAVQGIALNFFMFATAFIPLAITALYIEILDRNDYTETHYRRYEQREVYFFYAEVIGIVLFIILIESVFRKLYKRWYALPTD